MKKKIVFIIASCTFLILLSFTGGKEYKFRNADLSIDERVTDLLKQMTIEEKVGQMMNSAPAIGRLNIPAYNWWNEGLHGVARSPYHTTSYPQAIGMAATWDVESLQKMGDYTSTEGRAIFNDATKKGKVGIYCGLTYWTPNINIFRDPRWGRGQETYGEDPYLTGTLGKAFVRGIQGDDPVYLKASACAKHFAVHSGPESSRHTYNAVVSKYDLWDTYLPAFQDLVVEGKVSGVMCAYNAYEGQPCCGSDILMNAILRNTWGFTGYVTSDCGAINDFFRNHKTSPNAQSAAADAVLHGTDVDCGSTFRALVTAYKEGLITEPQIDISLRRLFNIRFRLGMFDPADKVPWANTPLSVLENEVHQAHALKMARQSIVLLKNDKRTLPLRKSLKKIAVVGPNADEKQVLLSNYYGKPTKIITVLEGLQTKLQPGTRIIYERGTNLTDNKVFKPSFNAQLFAIEGKQGFKGEYFQSRNFQGDPVYSRIDREINFEWGDGEVIAQNVIARNMSVRWKTTLTADKTCEIVFRLKGDDGCRLFVNNEKKIDSNQAQTYFALNAEKGKMYDIMIEYWQSADNANVELTTGNIEEAAPVTIANRVKDADAIIFVGGISASLEGEEMRIAIEGFSGGDRTSIALPKVQTELMKALQATGKPVVFVMMTGSALGIEWEAANIPAIVNAWYGGQAGGTAIADVLFGDYNPAGRLPVTFYKSVNDLPDFENYNMDNRTYRYFTGKPLFQFGFGLSYTAFKYENLEVPSTSATNGDLSVKVKVRNSGKMDGDEVVQLYLTHKNSSLKTPILALKAFKRIQLKSGEAKVVDFILGPEELSMVDENGIRAVVPGEIEVSVGGCQPSESSVSQAGSIQKIVPIAGDRFLIKN
jgi:beta-glucosidase